MRRRTWVHVVPTTTTLTMLLVGACWLAAGPAWAVDVGRASIVTPDGRSALRSGGSTTQYAIALPPGAHCRGDTAIKGYREWSYLVPKGTNLDRISFAALLPKPGFAFVANGEVFGPVFTAQGTGDIVGVPNDFVFSRLRPTDLFPIGAASAVWEGGLACANDHGGMSAYWNAEFRFIADSGDPGGFTWTVTHPVAPVGTGRPWWSVPLAAALVVGGVAAAAALWPRRRRTTDEVAEEVPA
jgi:hypothetical protein